MQKELSKRQVRILSILGPETREALIHKLNCWAVEKHDWHSFPSHILAWINKYARDMKLSFLDRCAFRDLCVNYITHMGHINNYRHEIRQA